MIAGRTISVQGLVSAAAANLDDAAATHPVVVAVGAQHWVSDWVRHLCAIDVVHVSLTR